MRLQLIGDDVIVERNSTENMIPEDLMEVLVMTYHMAMKKAEAHEEWIQQNNMDPMNCCDDEWNPCEDCYDHWGDDIPF